MTPLSTIASPAIVLRADDVDTDQIIPARFLKGTSKEGLGQRLFADWRGQPGFPLERPGARGAQVLVVGHNFGCGSSREHAAWALIDFGFRAIVARSFADIFRQNATKNGLVPVALPDEAVRSIEALVDARPESELRVDLPAERVWLPDGTSLPFELEPFAKHCLVEGIDELGYILSFTERIEAHEARKS